MANNKKEVNFDEAVFPAWHAAQLAEEMTHDLIANQHRAVKTEIPIADTIINPFFPGTLVSILGRPQNAKTFLSMYILQETMRGMQANDAASNEACILITTEVPVEVAALQWMARISGIPVSQVLRGEVNKTELERIGDSAVRIMGLPLFIVGHSIQRSKDNRRSRPALSPGKLDGAIDYILNAYQDPVTNSFIEPRLIVTDYLQRLHNDTKMGTVDFYSRAVDWAKDVALWAGAAHILNVQAGRQVDERAIKIPTLGDGQWTSNIEQSSDVVLATHMPKVYNIQMMDAMESWGIPELEVTNNLIYLALLKQKDGSANECWVFNGDMARLKLNEIDLTRFH